ncbi:hypothetical protein [Janthinobacterium sp. 1_2014MBL_MicDiv]|uniref:hypothetical protein n=1 Tax=Janthinobacterium sp. 1_2014MBL_MicDiv TaxID=1644131 RepID=UPI0012EC6790|nr:hypothetical protein [Janthinobacterium sp. 1_2014MBL_MicDiv]
MVVGKWQSCLCPCISEGRRVGAAVTASPACGGPEICVPVSLLLTIRLELSQALNISKYRINNFIFLKKSITKIRKYRQAIVFYAAMTDAARCHAGCRYLGCEMLIFPAYFQCGGKKTSLSLLGHLSISLCDSLHISDAVVRHIFSRLSDLRACMWLLFLFA